MNVLTIALAICVLVLANGQFMAPWGIYTYMKEGQKPKKVSRDRIEVSHPLSFQMISIEFKHHKLISNYGSHIKYQLGSSTLINFETKGQYLQIKAQSLKSAQSKTSLTMETTNINQDKVKYGNECSVQEKSIQCTVPFTIQINPEHYSEIQPRNTDQFMSKNNISSEHGEMTINGISQLISSICVFDIESDRYFGFCDDAGYHVKLSALSIELLADFNYELGKFIFLSYIDYLETKLIYTNHFEGDCLPLPERIEFIFKFNDLTPFQFQKVQSLLRNYLVIPMLSKLTTLQQEVNYREGKKLHPYLIQMLTQRWNKKNPIQGYKSIYRESFTQDFKYHDYGFTLLSNPAKSAWIFKVIQQYAAIELSKVKNHMNMADVQEENQQLLTLNNIMRTYISDEQTAKKGQYLSILLSPKQDHRLYSKYIGYDTFLPFIYSAGAAIPSQSLAEIAGPNGLKSSNVEAYNSKYRFRGDIHAYFNYILIKGFKERVSQEMKNKKGAQLKQCEEILSILKNSSQAIKQTILESYKNDHIVYTSWTGQGQGKESIPWLKIVTVMLLSDSI